MTQNSDEINRLIADVEQMNASERLLFVELVLKSFKEHELHQFLGRFQQAAGQAHTLRNLNLTKQSVPDSKGNAPPPRAHTKKKLLKPS